MRDLNPTNSPANSRTNKLMLVVLLTPSLLLWPAFPASASARSTSFYGAEVVNVSVNFNTQVPLADLSEETLADAQKSGRKFIYRLARDECAVLREIIARTCRMTNLNVSTQVQNHNNQSPVMLYINGNANFAVDLKSDEEER